MSWPYGILKDLGRRGRLLISIKHCLEDWTFQIRINDTHSPIQNYQKLVNSDLYDPLHYQQKIKICGWLPHLLELQIYGYHREKNPTMCQRRHQNGPWKMVSNFQITKRNACTSARSAKPPFALISNDNEMLITDYNTNSLALLLAQNYSSPPPAPYQTTEGEKKPNHETLENHSQHTLGFWQKKTTKNPIKLYRSRIRSKLDYVCFINGAARKSHPRGLNTISWGAFTTLLIVS